MSFDINKAILIGRAGKDAELRYTQSNTAVCSFSLATSDDQGKDREAVTTWHDCVLFGKLAEAMGSRIKKGSRIYVEGRISQRSWVDKEGVKQRRTEIIVAQIVLFDRAEPAGDSRGDRSRAAPARKPAGGADKSTENKFDDDDSIPF